MSLERCLGGEHPRHRVLDEFHTSRIGKISAMRLILALSLVLGLAACETTKGIGRDITNAGNKLDQAF